jgi:hypothetical protein
MNIKEIFEQKKEKLESSGYPLQHVDSKIFYTKKVIELEKTKSFERSSKNLYLMTLNEKGSKEISYIGFSYHKNKGDSFDRDCNDSIIVSAEVGLEKLDQVVDFLSLERQAEEIDSFMESFIEEINKEFSNEEVEEFYKFKELLSLPSSEVVRLGEFNTVLKWSEKIMVKKDLRWITLCSRKEKEIIPMYIMLEQVTSGELGRR